MGQGRKSIPQRHWSALAAHLQSSPQAHAVLVGLALQQVVGLVSVPALQQVDGLASELALQPVEALEVHMVADVVLVLGYSWEECRL